MQWLTQKEIKTRAKKSKREAIKVSWEHWEQLTTARIEELVAAFKNKRVALDERYCGLCQRDDCDYCPLFNPTFVTCCKEYLDAHEACNALITEKSISNAVAFQKAARKMANKLKRLPRK